MPPQSWTTLEYDDFILVCPNNDTREHVLASMTCSCMPRVELHQVSYLRPTIIHSSFKEQDAIDTSVKTIHE